MCWSIVLSSIVEAADENVENAVKRDEKQAEKIRELESSKITDGGVLASNSSKVVTSYDFDNRKQSEFNKIWEEMKSWAEKVITDAVSFASDSAPRSTTDLDQNKHEPSHVSIRDEMEARFNSSVWPPLKSRGWKSELAADSTTRYWFNAKEVGAKLSKHAIFHMAFLTYLHLYHFSITQWNLCLQLPNPCIPK
jgi:hypothetical protein